MGIIEDVYPSISLIYFKYVLNLLTMVFFLLITNSSVATIPLKSTLSETIIPPGFNNLVQPLKKI